MRLLRCLLMIVAALSMMAHAASAGDAHEVTGAAHPAHTSHHHASAGHAGHHHAGTAHQADEVKAATAHRNCPHNHHNAHGCCNAPCCGSATCGVLAAATGFERLLHPATPLRPAADQTPEDALHDLLNRPPILG